MTAVEALLQRADDVRRLFDEMLGPVPDLPNLGFVVDAANALRRFCSRRREPETDALALKEIGFLVEPFYRHLFTAERWRLVCRWASDDAMLIAASRGAAEELNGRWDVCTLENYLRFLEERERLLEPELLESLARGAVRESVSWGPDAPEARRRAEAVVGALRTLAKRAVNTRERWQQERDSQLEPAARALGRFDRQSASNAEPQPAAVVDVALEKAREIAPGWADWAEKYTGNGSPTKRKYWLAMNGGIPPNKAELKALETATDTIRKKGNRALTKKSKPVSRTPRT